MILFSVRHEGSPQSVDGLTAQQVVDGVRHGLRSSHFGHPQTGMANGAQFAVVARVFGISSCLHPLDAQYNVRQPLRDDSYGGLSND